MPPTDELLRLAKAVAQAAATRLLSLGDTHKSYTHSAELTREIKALADRVLDDEIVAALRPTGVPILSEESGCSAPEHAGPYRFIVDPLDGTFNFVRTLGPCAVSIALWNLQQPVFGVVYNLTERQLYWGGPECGAFADDLPIAVSTITEQGRACLCTGFPARFEFDAEHARQDFWQRVTPYAKVRMIGSAAVALLHVARGSADAYFEKNIMLWDVAAGLAIVQGAGGVIRYMPGELEHSLDVEADNGRMSSTA